MKINLMKKAAKRHPKSVKGVLNEPSGVQKAPKSVKEASRRGQARFTRVLYGFQATQVRRRNEAASPYNLPVREVN